MEIEPDTPRATPAVGAALPVLGAAQRGALTRYAVMLLEEAAGQADKVVGVALAQVAASVAADVAASDENAGGVDRSRGGDDARTVEQCFAAVRRHVLARQRREGRVQRAAATGGDESALSLAQRIERLAPKQREAVALTFSHGFGYEAIAGITGRSAENIGFLLHSALTHLRENSAHGARVAAVDDARVTDHVLGEMSAGDERGFQRALLHDPSVRTAVTEVDALVGELRELLEPGDPARPREEKQRRRSAAGFWRKRWVRALVVGIVVAGVGAWWFARQRSTATGAIATTGGPEEVWLKPDTWKLANALVESSEDGKRANAGEPKGSRDHVTPGRAVPPETGSTGETGADLNHVVLAGSAGRGMSGAGSAQQGPEASNGGAPAKEFPAGPASGAAAEKIEREGRPTADSASIASGGASEEAARPGTIYVEGAERGAGPQPLAPRAAASEVAAAAPRARAAAVATAAAGGDAVAERGEAGAVASAAINGPESRIATAGELRRVIAAKRWPLREAVSVESLLGFFPAAVAGTEEGAPIAVSIETAEAPWAPERRLVCVRLTAPPAQVPPRAAANVIFLIDISASMDGPNRLPLVQDAVRGLLQVLRPEDRVAIVTYAGEARVALPPTLVSEDSAVRVALGKLRAEGMTNGGAGLRRAYELAHDGVVSGGVNRVLLCTDGDFNMGVTSATELAALVEAEAQRGVGLGVFGFGRGRRIDPRLEALAAKGRGGSGNINTRHEAARLMAAEVNGWQAVVAREVNVEFACDPTRIAAGRWVGLGESFLAPEMMGGQRLRVAELSPGESVTALFEVMVTGGTENGIGGDREAGLTLRVGYRPGERGGEGGGRTLVVPVADAGTRWPEASADFKFSAAVAGLGLALGESPVAREKLEAIVQWAEAAAAERTAHDIGGYREEFLALAREARDLAREERRQ